MSEQFIRLASRLLLWGMLPLLIAICLDFYLVARIITGTLFASLLTVAIAALFASLWFVLPRLDHKQSVPAKAVDK